jgi:hypothetical protein
MLHHLLLDQLGISANQLTIPLILHISYNIETYITGTNNNNANQVPLSSGLPFHFPEVWFHSPAMFSSFFQSDLTHLVSQPSGQKTEKIIRNVLSLCNKNIQKYCSG